MNVSIRVSLETANLLATLKQTDKDSFDAVIQRQINPPPVNAVAADRQGKAVDPAVLPYGYRVHLGADVHSAVAAKEAMLLTLRYLGSGDPDFWPRLSVRITGRCRNHLSPRREAVYPGRPDLDRHIVEIVPGWFLGTNINNDEKMGIIRQALAAAGPVRSSGVKCSLSMRR